MIYKGTAEILKRDKTINITTGQIHALDNVFVESIFQRVSYKNLFYFRNIYLIFLY